MLTRSSRAAAVGKLALSGGGRPAILPRPFAPAMTAPRSIVVVKLTAIGDVLHGVPTAVALKRAFPAARIGWAVEGGAADVLAGHPAIDHLFRLPRRWLKSPTAVLSLRRQLRAFAPDVVLDLQGLLKSAVATWLSGAPLRIGHAPGGPRAVLAGLHASGSGDGDPRGGEARRAARRWA